MSEPLISIITPTYNRADLLAETIASVQAQTYPHWEMIIVDDGSTDDTRQLVADISRDDPRVAYYYQENSGQSKARQHALTLARGELIAFLDSDDRYLPHRLAAGVQALVAHPQGAVAYGDTYCIDANGERIPWREDKKFSGRITAQLVRNNCISFSTTLTRKSAMDAVGGFDAEVRVADDYDLWLRLSVDHEFVYIPDFLAEYRIMDSQISSDKTRRFQSNEATLTRFFARHPDLLEDKACRSARSIFWLTWSRHFYAVSSYRLAWRLWLKAFRIAPFSFPVMRTLVKHLVGSKGSRPD